MRAPPAHRRDSGIDHHNLRASYETIGQLPPRASALGHDRPAAEMFITGVVDKGGKIRRDLPTPASGGDHGGEYVVAWASQSGIGHDIVITKWTSKTCCEQGRHLCRFFRPGPQRQASSWPKSRQVLIAGILASISRRKSDSRSACCPTCPGTGSATWATPRLWAPFTPGLPPHAPRADPGCPQNDLPGAVQPTTASTTSSCRPCFLPQHRPGRFSGGDACTSQK